MSSSLPTSATASAAPLISVVTVVYNALVGLRLSVESVSRQIDADLEHIVVDGASTDGAPEWLRMLDAPHLRWISEPDRGIYDAMNKGLRMARGDYVYFLNAGDEFLEVQTLNRVSLLLADAPVLLMNRVTAVGADGADERQMPYVLGLKRPRELFQSAYCHQAAFMRRDAYLAAGGFDLSYPHFADFKALWSARQSKLPILETTLTVARFPLDGVSSNWRRAPMLAAERERLLTELGDGSGALGSRLRILKAHIQRIRMMLRERFS